MTIARLRGKLGAMDDGDEMDRLEDLLTSDVAGAWRYLPFDIGLGPVLSRAMDENGTFLNQILDLDTVSSGKVCRMTFWPRLADGKQPDLLARVWDAGTSAASLAPRLGLAIEVKLDAEPHVINGKSQLAHYLVETLTWRWRDHLLTDAPPPANQRGLLYLSAHSRMPVLDMQLAREEAAGILGRDALRLPLFWVGWSVVARIAREEWERRRSRVDQEPWLRHLLDIQQHLELRDLGPREPFSGIIGLRGPVPMPPFVPYIPHLPPRLPTAPTEPLPPRGHHA